MSRLTKLPQDALSVVTREAMALRAEVEALRVELAGRLRDRDEIVAHNAELRAERDALSDVISRCHKVQLDKTGATTVEPFDEILGRLLDAWNEDSAHHAEHHLAEEILCGELAEAKARVAELDVALKEICGCTCEACVRLRAAVEPRGGE